MVIQILNTVLGNLSPIFGLLDKVEKNYCVIKKPEECDRTQPIIIPGNANARFQYLKMLEAGFDKNFFLAQQATVIGICSGGQLLLDETEEGGRCLGIISGYSVAMPKLRIGWFGFNERDYYFVHRYKMISEYAYSDNNSEITSLVKYKNFVGVQFHPEKSGPNGVSFMKEVLSDAQNR